MYYSQCQEDEYLNLKYFKNNKNGVYIELGALDGVLYSYLRRIDPTISYSMI